MNIAIINTYGCCTTDVIELPNGKTWDDVEDNYVKWGTLFCRFKGSDDYEEISLMNDLDDAIDWKRPISTEIRRCTDEGFPDFESEPLDESD